jgi:hypothetical protein
VRDHDRDERDRETDERIDQGRSASKASTAFASAIE